VGSEQGREIERGRIGGFPGWRCLPGSHVPVIDAASAESAPGPSAIRATVGLLTGYADIGGAGPLGMMLFA
jgi:hypothetical protein